MNNQTTLKSLAGITLAIAFYANRAVAQSPAADTTAAPEIYKTIYLSNLTQPSDANEVVNAVRNMLPRAKVYYVPSQSAISLRATADDLALAQKILADMDKTKKLYRLTYTMTESDSGKIVGVQHFSIIVASGSKTDFKQGSRVPISTESGTGGSSSVTYIDVGQEIEASLDGYFDGVRLRTKVVQSSITEDKSLAGSQDPVIRQTTLEGTSTLVQNKPLVLGTFDVPGSTRHQEIEVTSELLR